jgi:hypothetical protein
MAFGYLTDMLLKIGFNDADLTKAGNYLERKVNPSAIHRFDKVAA